MLRVREHYPAAVLPLEEVRDEIVMAITDQRSRDAVVAAAEAAVLSLRDGQSVEEFANAEGYEWQVELGADRRNLAVPAEVLSAAFDLEAPAEGAPVVDYVVNRAGDAVVFELARVTPGDLESLPEAEQGALQQMVSNEYSQVVDSEYRQGLRERADVTVL